MLRKHGVHAHMGSLMQDAFPSWSRDVTWTVPLLFQVHMHCKPTPQLFPTSIALTEPILGSNHMKRPPVHPRRPLGPVCQPTKRPGTWQRSHCAAVENTTEMVFKPYVGTVIWLTASE